ncbi:hypothetical protein CEXT_260511 [Caerostris extrusa]|uniref:Uncharacterized protein n=1 Tax=Caerostris extrusa TaxID=172846 RepID=A0AAV4UFJ7_CAEEX|nr:hypothetical protein CEXT_260511 [Caerostris extrusa]
MKTKCACSKNNKRLRNVKIRKQVKAKEEHKFTPTVLFSNGPFRLKYSFLTPPLQLRVTFQLYNSIKSSYCSSAGVLIRVPFISMAVLTYSGLLGWPL